MRVAALIVGGLVAGLAIILGEVALNLWLLADEWSRIAERLSLPPPSSITALQGVIKLLLLGGFAVWLTQMLRMSNRTQAALLAGGIVWFLVWAWVQWGMLLAGYVTPKIALLTVVWGLFELPLATWLGASASERMSARFHLR